MENFVKMLYRLFQLSFLTVSLGIVSGFALPDLAVALVSPQVVTGKYHSVALKSDGTVWSWGLNDSGQLGDGSTTQRLNPVQVNGLAGMVAVAAGFNSSAALKSDGTVWVWGDGSSGQIGNGMSGNQLVPVPVTSLDGIVAIAAGSFNVFAVKGDGSVWAWGGNDSGQLGEGSTTRRWAPVQVAGLTGVTALSAGSGHTLALKRDGTLWAWGSNGAGSVGDGTTIQRLTPVPVTGISSVTAISAGYNYSMALKSDGSVWTWGYNGYGQLGDGTTTSRLLPGMVSGLSNLAAVSAGSYRCAAVKSDGTVWSWGMYGFGLDNIRQDRIQLPTQIAGLSGITSLSFGADQSHLLALKTDGTVHALGDNSFGQFGDGTAVNATFPVAVEGFTGMTAVATGPGYTLGLKSDATVWGLGDNNFGQLTGDLSQPYLSIPRQIDWATALAAGQTDTYFLRSDGTVRTYGRNVNSWWECNSSAWPFLKLVCGLQDVTVISDEAAIKRDGTLWTWGDNSSGQLGDGTTISGPLPVQAAGLDNVIAVARGEKHTLALKNNGTVWAWGSNEFGQVGVHFDTCTYSPFLCISPEPLRVLELPSLTVGTLNGVVAIAAGLNHSLALKNDGTVWAWGDNTFNQLGDGSSLGTSGHLHPVPGLDGIIAIAAGRYHSAALKYDGTVWSWGNNGEGQLGSGSTLTPLFPVQVSGLSGVVSLSAKEFRTVALMNDGTVKAWGHDAMAQLGNTAQIHRTGINLLLTISGDPSATVVQGAAYSFAPISAGATVFSIVNKPGWAAFDTASGVLSGIPSAFDAGVYSGIVITAANGSDAVSLPAFSITVLRLPTISGTPDSSAIAGTGYSFTPDASNVEHFSIINLPGWARFDTATGTLSGTPTLADRGVNWNIIIYAQSGNLFAFLPVFSITVTGPQLAITATAGNGGSISGPAFVGYGENASYSIIPAAGYRIADVQVDGVGIGPAPWFTFYSVTDRHTINVLFSTITYSVTLASDPNGSISGPAIISHGDSATFSITPAIGFQVADVQVDGMSVGAMTSYTFFNVTAPHTVSAYFMYKLYTVTLNSGPNGTISGPTTVRHGETPTYSFTPDYMAYHVADVTINGISVGPQTTYSFSAGITADTVIAATFAFNSYDVIASAGPGGSISGPAAISFWGTGIFTITPDKGYHVADVLVDGSTVGPANGYAFSNVISPHTISVSFAADSAYTITLTAGSGGRIEGPASVVRNGKAYYSVIPDPGYHLVDVAVDSVSLGQTSGISLDGEVKKLTTSVERTAILKGDGTVWNWGSNYFGELGNGSASDRYPQPVQVTGLANIVDLSSAAWYSLAARSDGTVWGWGGSMYGELGLPWFASQNVPLQINGLAGIVKVAAGGGGHGIALKNDGTVWSWGLNSYGQLGNGITNDRTPQLTPVQAAGISDVIAVAAGNGYSVALKRDGTVWTWGANSYGQLGNGTTLDRNYPTMVNGLSGITEIAAGAGSVYAVAADGRVWAWGNNANGELGTGTKNNSTIPQLVSGLNGIASVTPGTSYAMAIDFSGKAWMWGDFYYPLPGYLPAVTASLVPLSIPVFAGVTGISGDSHKAVMTADGNIWTWGYNGYGELGTGDFTTRTYPSKVNGLPGIMSDHTISATFAADSFIITVFAGDNGTVTGPPSVTYGSSATYTITPATGYHVAEVLVDGGSVGAVSSYTFSAITANHTISATFAINSYSVTVTAGTGGNITGPDSIIYGDSAIYTITAGSGYTVSSVSVDGASIGAVSSYTFSSVTANHTIAATFAAIPPLIVTTSTLFDGYLTSVYSQTLAATGGTLSYTWSITSGTLPAGLSLNSATGVISGTPTATGSATFTVQVNDAGGTTAARSLTITVFALPAVSTASFSAGTVGSAFSAALAATGGKASVTWSIASGTLPAGLTLSSAGVISGTPTTASTSTFTVRVTDANGKAATRSLSITVTAPSKPDLIVSAVSGPASITRGSTRYTFTATVKNLGTAGSAATKLGFYLSTSSTVSTTTSRTNYLVGTVTVGALIAGGSTTVTLSAAVPTSALAAGRYYIGAYVDNSSTVAETSETNNGKATSGKSTVK